MKNTNEINNEIKSMIVKCLKKSQSIDVSARLGLAKRNLKNITVTELEWIFNLNEEIN